MPSMRTTHPLLVLGIGAVVGLLAGAVLVRETIKPLDPTRLADAPPGGGKVQVNEASADGARLQQHASMDLLPPDGLKESFMASREAVRATYEMYTLSNILDRLSRPRSKPYVFKPSIYSPASTSKKADSTREVWTSADDSAPEVEIGEDGEEEDVHLWSDEPPTDDDDEQPEYWSIISYDLPLFVLWCAVLIWIEATAMFWRRSRDLLMQAEPWRKDDVEFTAQAAKESQWMFWRPYGTVLAAAGILDCVWRGIDVFDKCFWNWACWLNLDCNLRILTPAVAECTIDVFFPALMLTALVIALIFAAVWSCTRPYAALVCLGTALTGLLAVLSLEFFTCFLWLLAAAAFNYFWFKVLPGLPDCPEWYEDLGSLAFSSHPATRAIRDGESAQPAGPGEVPVPSSAEARTLHWCERVSFFLADLVQRHGRWLRGLWNGVMMRAVVTLCSWRRVRVFGAEHIRHIGSHDSVLLVSNHRSYFDFFLITVMGLWPHSGASYVSMYPVRSGYFYTALCGFGVNLFGSMLAMFPNVVNTASMKEKGQSRPDGKRWNEYAMRRTAAELQIPGTVVGIHPEGTRNKDADVFSMLPTKPGAGRVALECEEAHVIPVFIRGLDGGAVEQLTHNWRAAPWDHPIDLVFGPHVDLTDLRKELAGADSEEKREQLKVAAGERLTEKIKALAEEHRERVGAEGKAKAEREAAYQQSDLEEGQKQR